mgnify:CR=1 FL=1
MPLFSANVSIVMFWRNDALMDLYGRELCYRFPEALPTDNVEYHGYRVGEIVYWPSRHSFAILCAQNGEAFDMQRIGRIEWGLEELARLGDAEATITLEKMRSDAYYGERFLPWEILP